MNNLVAAVRRGLFYDMWEGEMAEHVVELRNDRPAICRAVGGTWLKQMCVQMSNISV